MASSSLQLGLECQAEKLWVLIFKVFARLSTRASARGGAGGQWPRGPWILWGPWAWRGPGEGPMGLIGPIEMKHRRPIFFWRSPKFGQENRFNFGELFFFQITWICTEKPFQFRWRSFFFWRSLENSEKSVPFSLPVLDCTKPEMRNIWAVPRPTLGSWRPYSLPSSQVAYWSSSSSEPRSADWWLRGRCYNHCLSQHQHGRGETHMCRQSQLYSIGGGELVFYKPLSNAIVCRVAYWYA